MRVLDLFSGIGGFSLGLQWAGMRTVAFCERDPWCRSTLARHWPGMLEGSTRSREASVPDDGMRDVVEAGLNEAASVSAVYGR